MLLLQLHFANCDVSTCKFREFSKGAADCLSHKTSTLAHILTGKGLQDKILPGKLSKIQVV